MKQKIIPISVDRERFYYLYFKALENIFNSTFSGIAGHNVILRDKEISLLAEIAKDYDIISETAGLDINDERLHRMVFDYDNRLLARVKLGLSEPYYTNLLKDLRKHGMIEGKGVAKRLHPLLKVTFREDYRIILDFKIKNGTETEDKTDK